MSSLRVFAFAVPVLLLASSVVANSKDTDQKTASAMPRNLILMIGDGMGFGQVSAHRLFADNPATPALEPTVFDDLLIGTLSTRPHGDIDAITDSAAGATAYACGIKTRNGAIGVDAEGRPCETVLERARLLGKRTGLVVTSQITHATPASFYAHVASRKQTADIAKAYLPSNGQRLIDLAFGGGADDFSPGLRHALQIAGVQLLHQPAQLATLKQLPVLATFAAGGLPMAIDRTTAIPSLAAMTDRALQLLDNREQGFFLLVEGSQIDWASHANDIVGTLSEMQSFADAIAVARRYAEAHPDTLLVITADHETGGLSLGRDKQYQWRTPLLRQIRLSAAGMAARALAGADRVAVLREFSPIIPTADDSERLQQAAAEPDRLEEAYADVIARHSLTGWTTRGHTGADVPLYAFGPGSEKLLGHHDNDWLGRQILSVMQRITAAPPVSNNHQEQTP